MDRLHWRCKHDVARDVSPYLLNLANRNDPICVVSPKVAKASTTRVAVAGIIAGVIALTFANGNTAYLKDSSLLSLLNLFP
jgi:hypothetical protein